MDLLELLFPTLCLGCGRWGWYVCPDCVNRLKEFSELTCPGCRKLSINGMVHHDCRPTTRLDGLISAFAYQGLVKKLVTAFKYRLVKDLTETLIELMVSQLNYPLLYQPAWTLVPVPLHIQRRRWRGFNQAEILVNGLAAAWHFEVRTDLLIRHRNTTPQMTLKRQTRLENLKGAFSVPAGKVIPQRVLLVDDVATTCATLNECAATLKLAGVKEVWGVTLAQAVQQ